MEIKLYILLMLYFLLGAIAFLIINKRKTPEERSRNWIKYSAYFLIINLLFFSILYQFFPIAVLTIILGGFVELIYLILQTRRYITGLLSLLIFSIGFYFFFSVSFLKESFLYFLLMIVTVFDAFSQIAGQYMGKRKLFPSISPNKTIEGLIGGLIFASLTGIVIKGILNLNFLQALVWAFVVSVFAFLGDLTASFIKRRYGVKDFSKIIPGHGGILDRFDSLIFGSLSIHLLIFYFLQ